MSAPGSRIADGSLTRTAPPDPPPTTRGPRARDMARSYGRAVVEVLPAWVAARVLVAFSLVLAHLLVNVARPDNVGAHLRLHEGLLGWDAGWYEAIAKHGYAGAGSASLRFFPLVPALARGTDCRCRRLLQFPGDHATHPAFTDTSPRSPSVVGSDFRGT